MSGGPCFHQVRACAGSYHAGSRSRDHLIDYGTVRKDAMLCFAVVGTKLESMMANARAVLYATT
jgi:hypothetical protein